MSEKNNKFENVIFVLILIGVFALIWEQINKSKYHKEIKISLAVGFVALMIYSSHTK